jgi:pimeloyl-ACP methyl ester carboxylesterase
LRIDVAPSVVLLPGLLCDSVVWRAQCDALGFAGCFVPSFGTLASLTDMARSVLDAVPAARFSLAGHSMGGRVALEIARLAPERIERLALFDSGLDPLAAGAAGEQERENRLALLRLARQDGMRALGLKWAPAMVHPARHGSPVFETILDMIERQTPETFEAQIHALLNRPDGRATLLRLSCPALFACGRQDSWSPLSRHEEMHALCPGSRLVVIEDSGHMSPMEQPAAVARALIDWMDL